MTFGNVTKCHKISHFFKSLVQSYFYLLCLNLIRNGSDKMDTYRTPASFPIFESVLYQEHTFTDKRQNTRNRRQNRFLPLVWRNFPDFCSKKIHLFLYTSLDIFCDTNLIQSCRFPARFLLKKLQGVKFWLPITVFTAKNGQEMNIL